MINLKLLKDSVYLSLSFLFFRVYDFNASSYFVSFVYFVTFLFGKQKAKNYIYYLYLYLYLYIRVFFLCGRVFGYHV